MIHNQTLAAKLMMYLEKESPLDSVQLRKYNKVTSDMWTKSQLCLCKISGIQLSCRYRQCVQTRFCSGRKLISKHFKTSLCVELYVNEIPAIYSNVSGT